MVETKKVMSTNLIEKLCYKKKAKVFGIIEGKKGYVKKIGNNVILIPEIKSSLITPYSEAFQAVVWHALVSHPKLQSTKTKW